MLRLVAVDGRKVPEAHPNLFPLLVSSVMDYAIFALDPTGHVLTWNEGAQRMKGYRPEEIIGQHFSIFYPPDQQASGYPQTELVLAANEGRWEDEGWRVRKDGTRFWANVVITALRDETGKLVGYGKVTRDLTERWAAEEERLKLVARERAAKAATAAAQESVRLRDEFVSLAAHELKTPLTSLRGFAQVLMRQLSRNGEIAPERLRDSLRAIDEQTGRMKRLVDQLLDVSRLGEDRLKLEPSQVDLVALVERAVHAARAADEDHEVTLDAPGSLPAVVDDLRFEQVLANLLDNAAKYSPGNTPIDVTLLEPRRNWARIEVRDHGVGVPMDKRSRLFERFFQAHAESHRSGLGLGLYIVKQIVERHGGSVGVEFPEDGGTRFVVEIPTGLVEAGGQGAGVARSPRAGREGAA